jgi:uncharacterized protein YlxW (UPF0749 family)
VAILWHGKRHWTLSMVAICLVLGALLGIQVHSQRLRGATEVGRQTGALVSMLTTSQAQLDQHQKEIERLRTRVAEYELEVANERGMARLRNEELQHRQIALGLLPVGGPGIRLVLGDSTMHAGDAAGAQDLYVIHDFDLVQITNELWAAGAEAVALNGQRLIPGSAIICSTRLIQVNDVSISAPFTFLVIGNTENLMSALNIRDGMLDRLRVLQFQVELTPMDEIVIPPVAVPPQYQYAQPVTEEESP